MSHSRVPVKYLPPRLTAKDRKRQYTMLMHSRNAYRQHHYLTRKKLPSYPHRPSPHVQRLREIYGVDNAHPTPLLAKRTGCSLSALKHIVRKGEGAYYSSGSRPNQTARSWGLARLASSLTAGKSAAVDYRILEAGCHPRKRAMRLARQSRKRHGVGQRRVPKTV